MSGTGTFAITSDCPMIGRPSGWSPKIAAPSTSWTLSEGSSSYIAISSITRCPSVTARPLSAVARVVAARWPVAPAIAPAAVTPAAVTPAAPALTPATPRPTAAALVAGSDGGELLGRLALDLGVVGQPQ